MNPFYVPWKISRFFASAVFIRKIGGNMILFYFWFFEKSLKYVSFAQMIVLNTISENKTRFKGL